MFAVCSPSIKVCENDGHSRFVFSLARTWRPMQRSASALEWGRVPTHKFVQPGCTVAANRIPSGPGRPILS